MILVVCVSMTALFAFIQAGGIHAAGVPEKNVILVAAHDSPEAAKVLADYTCDGIADQVEIQQAIDASRARGAAVSSASPGCSATVVCGEDVFIGVVAC